jgi:glycosyltransferase involved in cell wall biosynthesis
LAYNRRMSRRTPRLSELPRPPPGRSGWPWNVEGEPVAAEQERGWPSITVVTPSFNQGRFIEGTIRSVLLQGYPALEYFVLDGGSTDGAREVIERYAPWISWWRSEKDAGQSDAINAGFARATGRVIAWLNSDDRYLPGTLHSVARQVTAYPDAAAWIGGCRSVDERSRMRYIIEPHGLELPTLADWQGRAWFAQPASFYDRDKAIRAGPLDVTLHSSLDVDFFLRLAREGEFVGTSELWAEESVHSDAKTSAQPGRAFAELYYVQIRRGYPEIALRNMTRDLQELHARRRDTLLQQLLRRARRIARGHLGPARTWGNLDE